MLGLMFLMFFGVYVLISIWVVNKATEWAKANNRKPWLWSSLAAFVMYNLFFWDFIPTLITHKYYCDTQAGLMIYKTPAQWKSENPGLTADDLKPLGKNKERLWDFPYKPLKNNPRKKVLMINQRIYLDTDYEENFLSPIPIRISKSSSFIADNFDNKKLAQIISFQSGYGSIATSQSWQVVKFWLSRRDCGISKGGNEWEVSGFNNFLKQIIDLGK